MQLRVWVHWEPLNGFSGGPGSKPLEKFIFSLKIVWHSLLEIIKLKLSVSNKKLYNQCYNQCFFLNWASMLLNAYKHFHTETFFIFTIFVSISRPRGCLYEIRHSTWVRSQQNGEFHFIKTNCLYDNEFISPRWKITIYLMEK